MTEQNSLSLFLGLIICLAVALVPARSHAQFISKVTDQIKGSGFYEPLQSIPLPRALADRSLKISGQRAMRILKGEEVVNSDDRLLVANATMSYAMVSSPLLERRDFYLLPHDGPSRWQTQKDLDRAIARTAGKKNLNLSQILNQFLIAVSFESYLRNQGLPQDKERLHVLASYLLAIGALSEQNGNHTEELVSLLLGFNPVVIREALEVVIDQGQNFEVIEKYNTLNFMGLQHPAPWSIGLAVGTLTMLADAMVDIVSDGSLSSTLRSLGMNDYMTLATLLIALPTAAGIPASQTFKTIFQQHLKPKLNPYSLKGFEHICEKLLSTRS